MKRFRPVAPPWTIGRGGLESEDGSNHLTSAPPSAPTETCPNCGLPIDEQRAKCPGCGRWLRLPRNEWLEQLSELPAMAQTGAALRGTPWKELSPTIGFVVAIFAVALGLHFSSLGLVGLGGAMMPVCLVLAAIMEFRADRIASESDGHSESMGALRASSDWMAIGQNRRPRA